MNCKDCYHYECHKHWYTGFEDFDERYNKENIEHNFFMRSRQRKRWRG